MLYLKYDLNNEKVKYLIQSDKRLGKLIEHIGTTTIVIEEPFKCLVKYIIGQQISDKARETIWKKVCAVIGNFTPRNLLKMSDETLYKQGVPPHKIKYIKTLADAIINKRINLKELQNLPNEKVIAQLISVKGIGCWTAEMCLIFSLKRENVLSKSDGTIRRTIQWIYNLNEPPSTQLLANYFVNWMPYATIVSAYLWKAIELGLTQKSFDEIILKKCGGIYVK